MNCQGRAFWFALGGILIREADEEKARQAYDNFCAEWGITYPLHSVEIRNLTGNFRWLHELPREDLLKFWGSLQSFLLDLPITSW